jgi:hypothetical protein
VTSKFTRTEDAAELRQQAEEMARKEVAPLDALSPEEIRQTLHELRVHQIELEMQNEELRRAHGELDAARERCFDLYELAPVGYVTGASEGSSGKGRGSRPQRRGADRRQGRGSARRNGGVPHGGYTFVEHLPGFGREGELIP